MTLMLIASGNYPLEPIPPEIVQALSLEIEKHMKRYGLTDIVMTPETLTHSTEGHP